MAGADVADVTDRAVVAGFSLVRLGRAGGDRLVIDGLLDLRFDHVTASWRDALRAERSGLVS